MQEGMPKYSRLSATIMCTGVLEIGAYHSHKSTYMASYKVDNLIDAGHETNKYGNVHDETAHYNEVVEVWTGQSNNPVKRVISKCVNYQLLTTYTPPECTILCM